MKFSRVSYDYSRVSTNTIYEMRYEEKFWPRSMGPGEANELENA
jgi:hypothetical protein